MSALAIWVYEARSSRNRHGCSALHETWKADAGQLPFARRPKRGDWPRTCQDWQRILERRHRRRDRPPLHHLLRYDNLLRRRSSPRCHHRPLFPGLSIMGGPNPLENQTPVARRDSSTGRGQLEPTHQGPARGFEVAKSWVTQGLSYAHQVARPLARPHDLPWHVRPRSVTELRRHRRNHSMSLLSLAPRSKGSRLLRWQGVQLLAVLRLDGMF